MLNPSVLWPLDKDPEYEWEAQKYEHPVPSRQYILQALESANGPMTFENLAAGFGLKAREVTLKADDQSLCPLASFKRRLQAMQRAGQLMQTRSGAYGLVDKMHLLKGRIQGHKEGFGFFIPDDGGDDLFLSPKQMRQVFDGDRVLARKTFVDRRGRANGVIVEILERNTSRLVGQFFIESNLGFVVANNRRISQQVIVAEDKRLKARSGQFVVVEITLPPDHRHPPQGKIIDILGDDQTPGIEVEVAVHSHALPNHWSDAVLAEVDALAEVIEDQDLSTRHDLRSLPFVTIDGEDAKDFDDAVYAESTPSGGFKLWVAIADVSYYVLSGSNLDKTAESRGNSVYFPGHVIPMLPELLSNGVCSLKPLEDRLAMICQLTFSLKESGKVALQRTQFYEGVIRSHARLTYTQVSAYLTSRDPNTLLEKPEQMDSERIECITESIDQLEGLYRALLNKRLLRGAIEFDTVETKIVFNKDKKIADILPTQRNDAHRLIEECMLQANVAAAKLLEKVALPALYRVHRPPKQEKLDQVNDFLATLGLHLPSQKKIKPMDYQQVLSQVAQRADAHMIQTVLLRSMQQAVYEPDNQGHFGLAYEAYTHFTSPIRRYPDLVVHRAIRYLIRSQLDCAQVKRVSGVKPVPKKHWLVQKNRLPALGEHCSFTERRADEATRQAVDWLKCQYMVDKLGQSFQGIITGVVGFGFFVELKDVYVEGLVHVANLPSDYYALDAVRHCLVGERSGLEYALGESVEVQVAAVNVEDRQIDFQLVLGGRPAARSGQPQKVKKNQFAKGNKNPTSKNPTSKKAKNKGFKSKRKSGKKPS